MSDNDGSREEKNGKDVNDIREVQENGGSGVVQQAYLFSQVIRCLFDKFRKGVRTMNTSGAKLKHLSPPMYSHYGTVTAEYVFCMFLDGVCMCLCDYVTGEGDAEKK